MTHMTFAEYLLKPWTPLSGTAGANAGGGEGGKKEAMLRDFAFHVTSLLTLKGHDATSRRSNPSANRAQNSRGKPCSFQNLGVNAVQCESTSSLSASTRRTSSMLVVTLDATTQSTPADAVSLLIASLDALSTTDNVDYCRLCLSKNHKTLQCTFILEDNLKVISCLFDSNFKQLPTQADRTNDRSGRGGLCNKSRSYGGNISQETMVFMSDPENSFGPQQPALEGQKNQVRRPRQAPPIFGNLTNCHGP